MIDLHTHTLWSDGELIPAEHIRRAFMKGYEAIAITDHADASNIDMLCRQIVQFSDAMARAESDITVLPGVELTHVMPEEIDELTQYARAHGAKIVVVHGETIVEPVRPGTNCAAIEAKGDILAHPGLILPEEAELAAKNGVYLEITSKSGHSLSNGHVAKTALAAGASLVIDTDSHRPGDFIDEAFAEKVLIGCGLTPMEIDRVFENSRQIVKRKLSGG